MLRILRFLTHRTSTRGFGTAMAPPLAHRVCLVGIRNDPAGLQDCFFGGRGSIYSCQCFQELDMVTSIFRNLFVQDCSSQASGKEVQCLCCDFFFRFLFCVSIFREMGLRTSQKSCPIRTSFKTSSRIYPE